MTTSFLINPFKVFFKELLTLGHLRSKNISDLITYFLKQNHLKAIMGWCQLRKKILKTCYNKDKKEYNTQRK